MDPTIFFTASAIAQEAGPKAGELAKNVLGNAAYARVRRALPAVTSWYRGPGLPLHHHLQRALRTAYLAATKRLIAGAQRDAARVHWRLIVQDSKWFDDVMKWLTAEQDCLKDPRYQPPPPPGERKPSVVEPGVVEPGNEDAADDIARLGASLEQLLRDEWAAAKLGAVPDSVNDAFARGWTEQTQGDTNWFGLLSLYFAQELKTRPEVRDIFLSGELSTVLIELRGLREEIRKEMTGPSESAPPFFAPSQPDYFVGREANLETLRERLRPNGSVVPLAGIPGLGKTSLAIQFAHKNAADFEGVYWIDCAGLSLPAAATTLASQIGIKQDGPREDLLPEIRRRCGDRHYLLVLDGVETNDFRELIPGGRAAVLLTTHHVDLPFLARYRAAALKEFTPEDCLNLFGEYLDPTKVARREADYRKLAESLGWLPLGIAVAAGLLKSDVRYTLDRLVYQNELHLLAQGELDIGELLGSAILSAPEAARQLLAAMAVCAPSGFRLVLAAEVAGMEETFALDALRDLRGRSLVEEIDPDERRYRLHSLIRAAVGQDAAIEKHHAEVVAVKFESWGQHRRECEEDLPDWRLALDRAGSAPRTERIDVLTRLAFFGFLFLYRRGLLADGLHAMQAAEAGYKEGRDRAGLQASYANQALILQAWGKLEEAMALYRRVEAICEELGDRAGLSSSYGNQALILQDWGQLEEAMALHKRQEAICEELADRDGLQTSYGNQALILKGWGRLEEAMALHKREEAICEELGDRAGLSRSYGNQALILEAWGKLEEAMALHKLEEGMCEELGDRDGLQTSYGNQALILKGWGRLEEAMALHKREEAICEELGDRAGLSSSYANQALILQDWGKSEEAMALHKREEAICEKLGDRAGLSASYGNQAVALKARGKLDEAMALHKRQEAICEELGDRAGLHASYGNQAVALKARGKLDEAMTLLKRQEAICEELGDRASLGSSYGNQASILKAWGKPEAAIALLKRAEAICRELGLRESLRISLHNQAILFDQTGQPEKAAPLRAEAAAIRAGLTRGSDERVDSRLPVAAHDPSPPIR